MEKQVSIVTGAGRGIGRAIALRLASEGHHLVLISRTENELKKVKQEVEKSGNTADFYAGDVGDENFANETVKDILSKHSKIDHLINNAGYGVFKKLVDADLKDFQGQVNTNLFGIFNFSKAVLPGMIKQQSGSIINIASLAGKNAVMGGTMYTATKHAVLGLSKSLLMEVREYNIRVAAICPGSVDTSFGNHSEMNPISKGNILMPEDVAEVVSAVIKLPARALMSEIDLRPTNPKK